MLVLLHIFFLKMKKRKKSLVVTETRDLQQRVPTLNRTRSHFMRVDPRLGRDLGQAYSKTSSMEACFVFKSLAKKT